MENISGAALELRALVLELLVLEELLHEAVTRVDLLLEVDVLGGKQHLRLDHHQRRGEDQELADVVEVEVLDQLDVAEVLLEHARDRDVVDLDLLLPDEVEEQVHRSGEVLELDAIVHAHFPPSCLIGSTSAKT